MAITTISPNSDLKVEVVATETVQRDGEWREISTGTETFAVSRDVLSKSSPVLRSMLHPDSLFSENQRSLIRMEADSIVSMKVWFQILHSEPPNYDLDLKSVWQLIAICDRYDLVIDHLFKWFQHWYESQPTHQWLVRSRFTGETENANEDPLCLLFLAWRLDQPKSFLQLSRHAVYSARYACLERNPTERRDLHLPNRIIQQLNAARGRLKTIIFHDLYAPLEKLLRKKQACCDKTGSDYQRALIETNAWPIERFAHQTSINTLLDRLDDFKYDPGETNCLTCKQDYEDIVDAVVIKTRAYFDGLCLDCMDLSKSKIRSTDHDYWRHSKLKQNEFVRGCRVKRHSQPTWYFSFMGRREEMEHYRRRNREERASVPSHHEPPF